MGCSTPRATGGSPPMISLEVFFCKMTASGISYPDLDLEQNQVLLVVPFPLST